MHAPENGRNAAREGPRQAGKCRMAHVTRMGPTRVPTQIVSDDWVCNQNPCTAQKVSRKPYRNQAQSPKPTNGGASSRLATDHWPLPIVALPSARPGNS